MSKKSQNIKGANDVPVKQVKALAVMLRSGTQPEAEAEVSVAGETISRWLHSF
jgi:hypothetical protein